jgi:hypothetical protein
LSFSDALKRQDAHAKEFDYASQITHRASYDLLIDEKWIDGKRKKIRWNEGDALEAIEVTVGAAAYLDRHRNGLALIQSAQGVTADQYLDCALRIMPYLQAGDLFGLGGWCILGRRRSLMPVFREMIRKVIPAIPCQRVHIWGVLYAPAIGELLWMCDQFGKMLSTDSTGPSVRPARGQWGYMGWTDKTYKRPPTETRGAERARHVQAVRDWLAEFRKTEWYKEPR